MTHTDAAEDDNDDAAEDDDDADADADTAEDDDDDDAAEDDDDADADANAAEDDDDNGDRFKEEEDTHLRCGDRRYQAASIRCRRATVRQSRHPISSPVSNKRMHLHHKHIQIHRQAARSNAKLLNPQTRSKLAATSSKLPLSSSITASPSVQDGLFIVLRLHATQSPGGKDDTEGDNRRGEAGGGAGCTGTIGERQVDAALHPRRAARRDGAGGQARAVPCCVAAHGVHGAGRCAPPHLTVRETLLFCAMLRLPTSVPATAKAAPAEAVISELGLASCADTIVSNTFVRGVAFYAPCSASQPPRARTPPPPAAAQPRSVPPVGTPRSKEN
uniref:Uncharacterized protein n=1 Tax=Oryza nivara TaxID=4536 RepID=A0A0E0GNJ1_ORYNI